LLRALGVGVVGDAGAPAGPDDADPGAGDDAGGVRVALAPGSGVGVELRSPWRLHPGVVSEGGDSFAGAGAGGPAEVDAGGLAGGAGDWRGTAFGGSLLGGGGPVQDGPTSARSCARLIVPTPGRSRSSRARGWAATRSAMRRSMPVMAACRVRSCWTCALAIAVSVAAGRDSGACGSARSRASSRAGLLPPR